MIETTHTKSEIRARLKNIRSKGGRIALVPTMGALHEGHLSLVRLAGTMSEHVVVSVFVNPTQFGPGEDFDRYPRDLDRDVSLLESAGAHTVYAPEVVDMYHDDHATWVTIEGLADRLCGRSRPGHFRGVATIVAKLFAIVAPDVAVFGRKDYQQLVVIRRMARDLDMPVEIVGAPICREPDGLAMSSRNTYLSQEERRQATVLHKVLVDTLDRVSRGETDVVALTRTAEETLHAEASRGVIDYCVIVHPETLEPLDEVVDGAVMALAVAFGRTRLIDNMTVT